MSSRRLPHALVDAGQRRAEPTSGTGDEAAAGRGGRAAADLTPAPPYQCRPADDSHQLDLLSQDEAIAVFIENRERVTAPTEASAAPAGQDGAAVNEAERAAIAEYRGGAGKATRWP